MKSIIVIIAFLVPTFVCSFHFIRQNEILTVYWRRVISEILLCFIGYHMRVLKFWLCFIRSLAINENFLFLSFVFFSVTRIILSVVRLTDDAFSCIFMVIQIKYCVLSTLFFASLSVSFPFSNCMHHIFNHWLMNNDCE